MIAVLLALALTIQLAGCGFGAVEVSAPEAVPSTYQPDSNALERSVGMLRRLAILPIHLDVSPEDGSQCAEGCDWAAIKHSLTERVATFLRDERGYEVVVVGSGGQVTPNLRLDGADLDTVVARLVAFAEARPARSPPPDAVAIVREIGAGEKVDGVVVLHGSAQAMTYADWALMYATFTLSAPISAIRTGISLEADVFEVARGQLVWASRHRVMAGFATLPDEVRLISALLDPIEPALPAAFTREPPRP